MFTREMMKTAFDRASRSGFYHLINRALPLRRAMETGFDVVGAVACFSVEMVVLIRLLVPN